MKKLYISILFLTFVNCFAYGPNKRIGENTFLNAVKTEEVIKIDGRLSESVWQTLPFSSFTQRDPNEGKTPTEQTSIWVAYDEHSVYIAAKLYDQSPDSIVGLLSRRDNHNESDWFYLYLDPYNDKRSGYYFGVNAAGSICDGLLYNDSWNDNSWNGIWEQSVSKDNEGWIVEFRIPFTQIRFNKADEMKWGINASREILRKKERDYLIMVPKNESGFVSHFAQLNGLNGIQPKQRFEVLPYLVSKAQYLQHDADDPFYKSKQYSSALGIDFKFGLGSNLNFDATINPDFGQVEVDPAVINLTAFETYFDEKRPFFIEGSNIFMFGYGGSNNNMGFNWGNPEIFYSRRIGRSPQADIDDDGFVYTPTETRILGAGKLTGKIGDFNIGLISAATERTYSTVNNKGNVYDLESEPFTSYSIVRLQNEIKEGKHGIGFIGTSVIRDLKNDKLKSILSDNAFVFGLDGWTTLDDEGVYVMNGYFSGSYVKGTKEYITELQRKPLRYLQRPDMDFMRIDSNRTSLEGITGRITLNKQKGNLNLNSAIGIASPGFENNDLGFQYKADAINSHLFIGYTWYEPDGLFRSKSLNVAHYRGYNFDGDNTDQGYMIFGDFEFMNYYGINFNSAYNPTNYSARQLRGGPLYKKTPSYSFNLSAYSDNRNKFVVNAYVGYAASKLGTENKYVEAGLNYNPSSQINFSFSPFIEFNDIKDQWVTSVKDPLSIDMFGRRYLFANLKQTTVGGNIRLNWTFTPALSLQLFIQPLISTGDYCEYKEYPKPKADQFVVYGKGNSSIEYNKEENQYEVDPDGSGPANKFSFDKPDFNFKSIRGNIILRWEFNPGSVFYLVWTHSKQNETEIGKLRFANDFSDLMNTAPDNIFMAKITYWFDI